MATKKAKPNGQFLLIGDNVEKYFKEILVGDLPGVGPSTQHILRLNNWTTCEDMQSVPINKLRTEFGNKFGERLYEYCRGIDSKALVFGQVRLQNQRTIIRLFRSHWPIFWMPNG